MSKRIQKVFYADVAIILLTNFLIVELLSFVGLQISATSILPLPTNQALPLAIACCSLIGMYGLLRNSQIGGYFALLASVLEVVSGTFYLIKTFPITQLSLRTIIMAAFPIILGVSTITCIFKTGLSQEESTSTTSSRSSPLSTKNSSSRKGSVA